MAWPAHHRNGNMAAVTHHCQDMRSRSLSHGVVARYGIRSKQHSGCSHQGGVGRGMGYLSDARRFSRAQHAYMRLPTDSTARQASTRRPRYACSISTDHSPRVALVARTAISDLAARLGVRQDDAESSNLDGHSDAAPWWRFSKARRGKIHYGRAGASLALQNVSRAQTIWATENAIIRRDF